jgi:spore protease
MKHEVNLSLDTLYTDLAIESIKYKKVKSDTKITKRNGIVTTNIKVNKRISELINKKKGMYTTIEFKDVTDSVNKENVIEVLTNELKKYVKLSKDDLVLIVGLGNSESTPDSLGSKCVDNIIVTNHIYELGKLDSSYHRVCIFKPSVYGKTGIETSLIIDSITKCIKPKLIIVIDSLCSLSIKRLNSTIQITDTGINPGSGIGNSRGEISFNTTGIPVIAIGVPTVVSLHSILSEILPNNKKILDKEEYNLVVTPTEIDYIIECLSYVISTGINNVLRV